MLPWYPKDGMQYTRVTLRAAPCDDGGGSGPSDCLECVREVGELGPSSRNRVRQNVRGLLPGARRDGAKSRPRALKWWPGASPAAET